IGRGDTFLYEDPKENVHVVRTDALHFGAWRYFKTYVQVEPRVGVHYSHKPGQPLQSSYNRMAQNSHLIASGTVPVSFNTWRPSGYYLEPQLDDQFAVGYFRNLRDNTIELSVEAYYKKMRNVTDFADNAQLFFNEDLSTEFRQGDS